MTKINVTKPTGTSELLTLLSAFKAEENTYLVFDSEKISSTGLPIIYLSKLTTKLENILDETEWTSVKNYLKGIISGTNFLYLKPEENYAGDEVFYRPLTLPQSSFDLIKNHYNVTEEPKIEPVETIDPNPIPVIQPVNEAPPKPLIPNPEIRSNTTETTIEIKPEVTSPSEPASKTYDFTSEKATFLKACENLFDALVSKYEKELNALQLKEAELKAKEDEIATKLKDATEHLANAEAKEQVANIAHDNAKKIMDINSLMPTNPENPQTGVI